MTEMTERERFEQWATMWPRGWPIDRFDTNGPNFRAGQYCMPFVEYAWQAWLARADASTHKAIYEDEVCGE